MYLTPTSKGVRVTFSSPRMAWDGENELTQFTLFPILPYVTYRRAF